MVRDDVPRAVRRRRDPDDASAGLRARTRGRSRGQAGAHRRAERSDAHVRRARERRAGAGVGTRRARLRTGRGGRPVRTEPAGVRGGVPRRPRGRRRQHHDQLAGGRGGHPRTVGRHARPLPDHDRPLPGTGAAGRGGRRRGARLPARSRGRRGDRVVRVPAGSRRGTGSPGRGGYGDRRCRAADVERHDGFRQGGAADAAQPGRQRPAVRRGDQHHRGRRDDRRPALLPHLRVDGPGEPRAPQGRHGGHDAAVRPGGVPDPPAGASRDVRLPRAADRAGAREASRPSTSTTCPPSSAC